MMQRIAARSRFAFQSLAAAAVLMVITTGCSSGPEEFADLPTDTGSSPATQEPAPVAKAIQLIKVDKAGYEAEVAKHHGKIVVVDFWATWCEPCKERFPHLVELSHQFDPEQVAFISMSLDPADLEQEATEFLVEHNAHSLTNLITTLGTSVAFDAYDIHDGIPNYKLYDRDGKLLHRFSQFADPDEQVLANDDLDIKLREALAK